MITIEMMDTERVHTVYPKKYAHGFCFAVLCCGYTLTDYPISIRLTSLALWQSNDCPSASKASLMNMDKYFMWIHYELLHNHNKAKHNKTVCIFLGIYCIITWQFLVNNRSKLFCPAMSTTDVIQWSVHIITWCIYNIKHSLHRPPECCHHSVIPRPQPTPLNQSDLI